jgi:hypothetical protein
MTILPPQRVLRYSYNYLSLTALADGGKLSALHLLTPRRAGRRRDLFEVMA